MADNLETVAAETSRRALEGQEQSLKDLRARAGTLLTGAALTVSFLGAQAIDREGLGVLAVLAVVAFVGSLLATLWILLPSDGLIFALDGPELYEALYEVRDDPAEVQRRLAYWIAGFRAENHPAIQRLFLLYKVATWALAAQVVLWAAQLSSIL